MSKQVRFLNGYRLIYSPDHPSAMTSKNWNGYVYEHIAVAEDFLGRKLSKDEVVHHLDLDRSNNRSENLIVLLRSQHSKIHAWIDKGAPIKETLKLNVSNSQEPKARILKYCFCGKILQAKEKSFCSESCKAFGSRKVVRPEKEQLKIDISNLSWVAIGEKYGVSDNAVRKWARRYDLL